MSILLVTTSSLALGCYRSFNLFKFNLNLNLTNVTYCQLGLLELERLNVELNFDFPARYVKFPSF